MDKLRANIKNIIFLFLDKPWAYRIQFDIFPISRPTSAYASRIFLSTYFTPLKITKLGFLIFDQDRHLRTKIYII